MRREEQNPQNARPNSENNFIFDQSVKTSVGLLDCI